MKCKCKIYSVLLLGITAGFIISTCLQSLIVSNLSTETTQTNGGSWSKRDYMVDGTGNSIRNPVRDSRESSKNTITTTAPPPPLKMKEAQREEESNRVFLTRRQSRGVMEDKGERASQPLLMSEEISSRQPLTIGVITSKERLSTHCTSIHNTWAKSYPGKVIYFTVGEDVSSMPRLPHSMKVVSLDPAEQQDPSTASWDSKEFLVVKHLINQSQLKAIDWFVVISDGIYLNIETLKRKLEDYEPSDISGYIGSRLSSDENKCNPVAGIVYSRGLMKHLETRLPQCEEDGQSISECIALTGIHCTQAKETLKLFYHDKRSIVESASLFSVSELSQVITIYPIKYPKYMYRLHTFYLELEHNSSTSGAAKAIEDMTKLHPFVPTHLRSPHRLEGEKEEGEDSDEMRRLEPTSQISLSQQPAPSVRPPHPPKNKFEINFWDYFNQTRIMSVFSEQPSSGIIGGLREEARYVLTKAIYIANQGVPLSERLMFEKLENGYHRTDPMRGSEYILDFVFRKTLDRNTRVRKRINILRPFHESVVPINPPLNKKRVNFIVTLSGLSNRLEQFLRNFERNVFTQKEDASLTIVLYEGPESNKVHELVNKYTQRHSSANINIIETQGNFARGVGLHQGTHPFKDHELLFFVDVDLEVKTDFIHRCQLNTIQNKQVYFPIFFKLYNLDFVNKYYKGNESQFLSRHNGHWAHYSYGMVCIYASDYRRSGGFNSKIRGWGEEDIDLLNRVISKGLEIFRAPDPGLIHLWHRKECDKSKIASKRAYKHCLQSKAENLADRTELAHYVFQKEISNGNDVL